MYRSPVVALLACVLTLAACGDKKPTPAEAPAAPAASAAAPAEPAAPPPAPAPAPVVIDPATLAVATPAPYQPASSADAGLAPALLATHQKACATRDAPLFFSLFTERVRYGFSRQTSEELMKYFADICRSFPELAATLEDGVSISPDTYSVEDGQPISNMCPQTADGICKEGINVGLEDGQLKFSER